MSKKQKNMLLKYLPLGAALLGLVAVIMIFCPMIDADDDVYYNGLKVVFGYTMKTDVWVSTLETQVLSFSFMNLLTYILAIVGVVFSVLAFLKPDFKLFTFIAAGCFAVAAVFFFCVIPFTVLSENLAEYSREIKDEWELGAGAIIGGIFCIISALASLVPLFLKKK